MKAKFTYNCAKAAIVVACILILGDFARAQDGAKNSGGEKGTADRTITQPDGRKTFIVRLKDGRTVSFGEDGGGGYFDKDGSIITMNLERQHVTEILKRDGRSINEILPAETLGKQRRSLIGVERTANGNIQRYSDGSTLELRPDVIIESLPDGTKIEKLPEGSTIVRWPDGRGFLRNADGTGADLTSDGSIVTTPGNIEVLPGGIIRQTLKDDGVVIDKFQDGTVRSRPDLAKTLAPTISRMEKPATNDLLVKPQQRQFSSDSTSVTRTQPRVEPMLGGVLKTDSPVTSPSGLATAKDSIDLKKPVILESPKAVTVSPLSVGRNIGEAGLTKQPARKNSINLLK